MPSNEKPGAEPLKDPCDEVVASMYEFIDRELATADVADIKSHLDDCIPCLEAFEFETELKMLIASKCKDEVPAQLYERIRISIQTAHFSDGDGKPPTVV